MQITRWAAGLAVTAAAAGGLALGTGSALADTPSPTPAPHSHHSPSDHSNSAICAKRVPAALARIDKITTRIDGDSSVRGSTAWLSTKADEARKAGDTALADLLTERAADRPARLAELAKLKGQVEHVQSTDCAA